MSPIIDIQYRLRELGRIRMGKKGPKGAPVKLNTWRLTSASEELLQVAAGCYGGEVTPWADSPNDGAHFELITKVDALPIVIPPNDAAFSQWMETWSGGGCQKRCDGQRQVLRDIACSCPSDINERMELAQQGKACKPTTRFNVLLPDIPDIGVWRLESHGYNAAVELAAFDQLADVATQQGRMIRARLRIDHRSVKREGKTNKFTVPVVEISHTVGDMLQALGADIDEVAISLPAPVEGRSLPGEPPALPATAPEWDIPADETPVNVEANGFPDWLNAFCDEYGEGETLDAINALRARGGMAPLQSLGDVAHDIADERLTALRHYLALNGAGDGPTEGEPEHGTEPPPASSDPVAVAERAHKKATAKGAEGESSQARGDDPSETNGKKRTSKKTEKAEQETLA